MASLPAQPAQPTPPQTPPATPARQRRKQARPQELQDAALMLFVEKGYAATRIEEVAQHAGVSKGTLYLYYPNKEELFKAVVRQNLSSLIAQAHDMALAHEGSSSALLEALMRIWWERLGDTPAGGIHKIVVAEVRNFPDLAQFYTDEVILPAHRLFTHCVQRGIDRGEFRPVPLDGVSKALIAPLLFLVLHRHSFDCCPVEGLPEMDPIEFLHISLNLMLRGLEVRDSVERSPS